MTKTDANHKNGSPQLVILMGLPLTGKTTVGTLMTQKQEFVFLDVDQARHKIEPEHDSQAPRNEAHESEIMLKSYAYNHRQALKQLRLGKSVILAATYSKPIYHQMIVDLQQAVSIEPRIFMLVATESSIVRRLKRRSKQTAANSNINTINDYHSVQSRFVATTLHKFTTIQTDDLSGEQVALLIIDIIE